MSLSKELTEYTWEWKNFDWWLSDDIRRLEDSTAFQDSVNVDIRTDTKWVQLWPKFFTQFTYDSPVVWMINLNDYGWFWLMTYHENWKIYVDWIYQNTISTTADTIKKIYNVSIIEVSWVAKIVYIWHSKIHVSNIDLTWFQIDLYTYDNTWDIISRPLVQFNDRFYFGSANLLYFFQPWLVFLNHAVLTFNKSEKIVWLTMFISNMRIYTTQWMGTSNWSSTQYNWNLNRINSTQSLVKWETLPIKAVIWSWSTDYVICWLNSNYAELWITSWYERKLLKKWIEIANWNWRFKFTTNSKAVVNRKWFITIAWNNWPYNWLFTYWSYYGSVNPSMTFETNVINIWDTWQIDALFAAWNVVVIAYTSNWVSKLGAVETQYAPTNWYQPFWHIKSQKFNAERKWKLKEIKEIIIAHNLWEWNEWTIKLYATRNNWDEILLKTITNIEEPYTRIITNELYSKWIIDFYEIDFRVELLPYTHTEDSNRMTTPKFNELALVYHFIEE